MRTSLKPLLHRIKCRRDLEMPRVKWGWANSTVLCEPFRGSQCWEVRSTPSPFAFWCQVKSFPLQEEALRLWRSCPLPKQHSVPLLVPYSDSLLTVSPSVKTLISILTESVVIWRFRVCTVHPSNFSSGVANSVYTLETSVKVSL